MKTLPIYPSLPELAVEEVKPLDSNPQCEACDLCDRVRTVCMSPEIYGDASKGTILVLGQGPGEAEDRHGRPNVGQAGSYLRDQLAKLWAGAVVFDNAVRCAPGIRKITSRMIQACRPYVARTIEEAKPDRIICLGASAIESIVGDSYPPFSVRKGYTYLGSVPVFFMQHPVTGLRNRFVRGWFEEDLAWATVAKPVGFPKHGVCMMVETVQDAREALGDLELAASVTWDLETFGAPFNPEYTILNLAVTPEGCEYAYVLEEKTLNDPKVARPIFEFLRRHPSGGQNIKFDCVGLFAKYGAHVENVVFDTMLWRRLLDADALARLEYQQALIGMAGSKDEADDFVQAGCKELRKMCSKPNTQPVLMASVPEDKLQIAVKRIRDDEDEPARYAYAAIPAGVRSAYNAKDTISTERLRAHLANRLGIDCEIQRVWTEVVQEMNYAITEMEINGIAVSMPAIQQLQVAMATKISELETRFTQFGDFNPNSAKQVGDLLFSKLGLPDHGKTPGGQFSCTAEILSDLNHPVARDIVAYRQASHFKSQYADGMALYVRGDGRIHPNIQIVGTGTGRPSCDSPNLFNIPKRTAEGKMCRDVFVDYSQIELRVAAMLSGDGLMIDLFKQGVDFHLATAKLIAPIFNIDPATVDKDHPLRDQSKTVNFATLYGDPAAGLAAKLKVSRKMAVALQNAILGKFKKLKAWIDERLRFGRLNGFSRTWWNGGDFRRRPLWQIADAESTVCETAERSTWNTPIQGTAADFTNASLGKIQRWIEADLVPAKLVLTLYDAIMAEVDEAAVDEYVLGAKAIMESWPVLHGVPIIADAKVGYSWGSMEAL
jgi:uracil-DNA glycosylase family 4